MIFIIKVWMMIYSSRLILYTIVCEIWIVVKAIYFYRWMFYKCFYCYVCAVFVGFLFFFFLPSWNDWLLSVCDFHRSLNDNVINCIYYIHHHMWNLNWCKTKKFSQISKCFYWSYSQILEYTIPICHDASFCNRNVHMCAHFCCEMVHCGLFVRRCGCG